jgi:hypothetical protein
VAHPGTQFLRSIAGTAEAVTWTAPDGLEIDGILCLPAGDGPFPLVVSIHGGPVWTYQNSWMMRYVWVPLLVSRGYAVLSPNPRRSSGRGQEFARHVVEDMGGADTHDYLSGIDTLVEPGLVDGERIGLIGRSYGGFMSSWLVTQDSRFAAAVPISPVTDWYSQSFTSNIAAWGNRFLGADPEHPDTTAHTRSPVLHASKARTPCLNVAGARDNCTSPGASPGIPPGPARARRALGPGDLPRRRPRRPRLPCPDRLPHPDAGVVRTAHGRFLTPGGGGTREWCCHQPGNILPWSEVDTGPSRPGGVVRPHWPR